MSVVCAITEATTVHDLCMYLTEAFAHADACRVPSKLLAEDHGMHAVDTKAQITAAELLEAVGSAERERAAAPDEIPLGQWTAVRVQADLNLTSQPLTSQLQLTHSHSVSQLEGLMIM